MELRWSRDGLWEPENPNGSNDPIDILDQLRDPDKESEPELCCRYHHVLQVRFVSQWCSFCHDLITTINDNSFPALPNACVLCGFYMCFKCRNYECPSKPFTPFRGDSTVFERANKPTLQWGDIKEMVMKPSVLLSKEEVKEALEFRSSLGRKDTHVLKELIRLQTKQRNMEPLPIIKVPIKTELKRGLPIPTIQSLLCTAVILSYIGDVDTVCYLL